MAIPEGYTALAKLGYADKGNYSASATYMAQDVVYHNGSSWVCKVDNTKGVTPAEGNNWHLMARGFAAETAANITATDVNNILGGGANKTGPLQPLLNKITDFIVNRAISNDNFVAKLSERLVNNGTTNQAGFALDARFGKSLQDQVSVLNDRDPNSFNFYGKFSAVGVQTPCSINDVINALKSPSITMLYILNGSISDVPLKNQAHLLIFKHDAVWFIINSDIWSGKTYIAVRSNDKVGGWIKLTTEETIKI